jgi:hypothetical protein
MVVSEDFTDRFVTLPRLILPVDAYRLLLDLEGRGFRLHREGTDVLVVQPHERLTRDDVARIRRWKWHVLAYLENEATGAFTDQPPTPAKTSTTYSRRAS